MHSRHARGRSASHPPPNTGRRKRKREMCNGPIGGETVSGMRGYVIRRIAYMMLMFFALVTLLFFMFRLLPGDPFATFVDAALPPEARQAAMEQFGLDKPLHIQYVRYVKNLFRGEFGTSFYYVRPVLDVLGEKLMNTLILAMASITISFTVGVLGGAVLAWRRGTRFEAISISIVMFFRSAPTFWTGMMVLMLFASILGWFPPGGVLTPGTQVDGLADKYFSLDFLWHLTLPVLVAVMYDIATPLLVMRSSMLEIMKEDFIEMAYAKGLPERIVLLRHAARNALLPIVTLLAVNAGFMLGGMVLIETVFNWPGIGREIVLAISRRDFPIAQAAFFFMGAMVIIMNFIADLSYGYLDPRVVYDDKT